VITGEGRADASSTAGKATGELVRLCRLEGTAVAVIAGEIADDAFAGIPTVSLVRRFGQTEALTRTLDCVARASEEMLAGTDKPGRS
jgi:glycerate kinase